MPEELSVLIPAYNEAARLPRVLSEIEYFMIKRPGLIVKIIVVDDGSKDSTVERALRYSTRLPLVVERLAQNSGKWSAIFHGLSVVDTDAVLILDADGSAPIHTLDSLNLGKIFDTRTSIFGSRYHEDSVVENKSFGRLVISRGYRFFVSSCYYFALLRSNPVEDMQAPFKLIFKSRLTGDYFIAKRFAGDLNLALLNSGPINNVPLHFIHRTGGSIKFSTIFDMFFETIKVAVNVRKYRKIKDIHDILYVRKQQYF